MKEKEPQLKKIEILRERCKTDLKFLVTKVMQMPRWSDALHGDLVRILEGEGDRKLILLPRGHQKSTIITVAWTIQQLLRNPDLRVQIISATWKLSKDLLHQIKGILESSVLKDLFGEFYQTKCRWTIEVIDIAQRTKMLKDPTITTLGIDTGKTGSHCDLMVFEDIVVPENSNTSEQIQKTISSYRDCLPLLDPGGRIVIIGTRYALSDLYGYLIANEARSINGNILDKTEDRNNWRKFINA